MNRVVRHIRTVAILHARDGPTDAQLVESFVARRDEAAFEALLRRHGPMVLGVCRRVLRHAQDAEDAFQATFLVLARKAGSLRSRELLGNWLYGVAQRTAMKARAMTAKRRTKEHRARELSRRGVQPDGPSDELLARLDSELSRLPDKYRVPVVLCELEGKSRKEVARLLGLPDGTLSWRLAHAKKLLARRLSRYGAALSVGSLAAVLSREAASACVPASLLTSTARVAVLTAGVVSARVVALTEGVIRAMLLSKLKLVWALTLAVVVGAGAVGLTYRPAAAQPQAPRGAAQASRVTADELDELRLEVAALRKGLEATRQRLKALEDEVHALRGRRAGSRPAGGGTRPIPEGADTPLDRAKADRDMVERLERATQRPDPDAFERGEERLDRALVGEKASPLVQAEAALKKLRANPNDKQAADALERALQRLKQEQEKRVRPDAPTHNRNVDRPPRD
jgi:RNA polymerase sigma factor (sigma-70 family)